MKKLVLGLGLALFALAPNANSQVIFTENFDGPTAPALPSGWSQASTGAPGWKTQMFAAPTTTGWASATGVTPAAHATQIALVDDWIDSGTVSVPISNLHDTLKSQIFSLAGSTAPWLNFDFYFHNAVRSSTSATEEAYVLGSTDGGATWTSLQTLTGDGFSGVWTDGHVDLSSLGTGTNVRVAFTYTDDADHLLGLALDNVQAENLTSPKAAISALYYNSIQDGISADGQSVSFLAQNNGIAITSITAKYTINGGTPVTQTFSSLSVAPYATSALTFTTPIAGSISGSNALKVTITAVNGVTNTDVDSAMTSNYTKASSATGRQGLIEEFSSSTCAPCASFNAIYDPLCVTYNVNNPATKVNIVKYQMNWPSPGTDKSYNPHGVSRRTYYNCNSIPMHFVNGVESQSASTAAALTAELNASKAESSFMDMNMTYTIDTVTKKLGVTLNVTPHFTMTGSYKVFIAVMDKHYQNTTKTTSQLNYYHIMRMMLPDGNGNAVSSWTDGTTQTFTQTGVDFTYGYWPLGNVGTNYPAQGSYKFWNNLWDSSEVICFVQNVTTGSILQSLSGTRGTASTTLIPTTDKIENIALYPNPTANEANLSFNLAEAGKVQVAVVDYTGKVLSVASDKEMGVGVQNVKVSTANLQVGS